MLAASLSVYTSMSNNTFRKNQTPPRINMLYDFPFDYNIFPIAAASAVLYIYIILLYTLYSRI